MNSNSIIYLRAKAETRQQLNGHYIPANSFGFNGHLQHDEKLLFDINIKYRNFATYNAPGYDGSLPSAIEFFVGHYGYSPLAASL